MGLASLAYFAQHPEKVETEGAYNKLNVHQID